MADPNHDDIIRAIVKLETTLNLTLKRLDENDKTTRLHRDRIYAHLQVLDAARNVSKGRRAILTVIAVAAAGAVGVAVTKWIG